MRALNYPELSVRALNYPKTTQPARCGFVVLVFLVRVEPLPLSVCPCREHRSVFSAGRAAHLASASAGDQQP